MDRSDQARGASVEDLVNEFAEGWVSPLASASSLGVRVAALAVCALVSSSVQESGR